MYKTIFSPSDGVTVFPNGLIQVDDAVYGENAGKFRGAMQKVYQAAMQAKDRKNPAGVIAQIIRVGYQKAIKAFPKQEPTK
jgi:hypothetical protein